MCRSEVHGTTNINGKRQKDPLGDHVTLCYKDEDQLRRGTHVASHGYVKDGSTLEFVQATHHAEKPDSTKKRNREDVWPSEESLAIAPEIGYGIRTLPRGIVKLMCDVLISQSQRGSKLNPAQPNTWINRLRLFVPTT